MNKKKIYKIVQLIINQQHNIKNKSRKVNYFYLIFKIKVI